MHLALCKCALLQVACAKDQNSGSSHFAIMLNFEQNILFLQFLTDMIIVNEHDHLRKK